MFSPEFKEIRIIAEFLKNYFLVITPVVNMVEATWFKFLESFFVGHTCIFLYANKTDGDPEYKWETSKSAGFLTSKPVRFIRPAEV